MDRLKKIIEQSVKVKQDILNDDDLIDRIHKAAAMIINTYQHDGKVLLCGNGGSAADAQHIAAELSGRFYFNRKALNAEALHVNSSFVTAVANDFSFDEVFSRSVEAFGQKNDILIMLSTSGNSVNIINAAKKALESGMSTIALTGESGGILKEHCTLLINVPSNDTPRIQEAHILIGHIICEIVESTLFKK